MSKRNQPHDRYFKDMFQHRDLAKEFLSIYLDQDIYKEVDWNMFNLYDTSLIGARGSQKYADVFYSAQIKGQPIDVLFMLNHERKPDEFLGIRIGEYALGAMRRSMRQKNGRYVFVLSFTLYNGLRRPYPYTYPYPYSHLIGLKSTNLIDKLLLSTQNLLDVSIHDDTVLTSHGNVGIVELFMKHVNNVDVATWLCQNKQLVENLEKSEYLHRSLLYLADVNDCEVEKLVTLFEKLLPKSKENMLTIRQQIEKKGVQQGIQQGMQCRDLEIARQMLLHLHLSMDVTQKATGLSREVLEKLQKGEA